MFLTAEEIRQLTGRAQKARQVEWLRAAGVPFYINAAGHPIVARAVIEGRPSDQSATLPPWRPAVLGS